MMMGSNNMANISGGGLIIAIILFVIFWAGIILLAFWFYSQFAQKKEANILAWGLILLITVSIVFCFMIWFGWGSSLFGGWSNMMSFDSEDHELMHHMMENH